MGQKTTVLDRLNTIEEYAKSLTIGNKVPNLKAMSDIICTEVAKIKEVMYIQKLPKAIKHNKTGAVEYINEHGTYRSKGCNGSAYGYEEHYKIGYRPIDISFHDFVVGVSFDSATPEEFESKGYDEDLKMLKKQYNTGTNGLR